MAVTPKSYVITDRKKLDAFLKAGGAIEDLELRVGILEGRTRYAPRHVGRKSRLRRRGKAPLEASELARRRGIRELRSSLEVIGSTKGGKARRALEKEIRAAFRAQGVSTKGLRKSTRGTAVARVAGVLQAGTPYHVIALNARRGKLRKELDAVLDIIKAGKIPRGKLAGIGKKSQEAIRRGMLKAGHVDTGKLRETTKFEIINTKERIRVQQAARAERAARRAARRAR
jgi:hypothetical protein